jgi:E3 ubiquitin-protein ligase UBR2
MSSPLDEDMFAGGSEGSSIRVFSSPNECLQWWNKKFKQGDMTAIDFRDWWKQSVPKLFSPDPSMNYQKPFQHIEEDDEQKNLFDVLERFLCDGDPNHVFQMLTSFNNPPAQCVKVFKFGEPTYSCRDCGLDPTCVLCFDCFKNSKHVEHRYKMSTSDGGGYCDCGDVEAWKQFPACPTHEASSQVESVDPVSKVPLGLQLRAKLVFTAVLKYAVELLTLDTMMKLPGDLQYTPQDSLHKLDELLDVEDMYATVLYNDEVHTFDEVIPTLQRTLDIDKNKAVGFASLIDREGRCVVKCGQYQGCAEIKRNIERITGRRSKPLMVKVVHSHVVAHQASFNSTLKPNFTCIKKH